MPYKDKERLKEYTHFYYLNNKEKWKKYGNRRKKDPNFKTKQREASKRRYHKMKELCKNRTIEWMKNNPDKVREIYKRSRLKILKMISTEIKCVRCGCDEWRFLEINHKNGGWNEFSKKLGVTLTNYIRETGNTRDLELLCKPCNSIHALELKFNRVYLKTIWNPI